MHCCHNLSMHTQYYAHLYLHLHIHIQPYNGISIFTFTITLSFKARFKRRKRDGQPANRRLSFKLLSTKFAQQQLSRQPAVKKKSFRSRCLSLLQAPMREISFFLWRAAKPRVMSKIYLILLRVRVLYSIDSRQAIKQVQ